MVSRKNNEVTLAVISDLHINSSQGLSHPFIQKCFMKFVEKIPKNSIGIINGDLLQGVNLKWLEDLKSGSLMDELISINKYIKAFYEKCREVYSTYGTPSHSKNDGVNVERIVNSLFGPKIQTVQLYLEVNGWRLLFQHGRSGALVYKESILRRELRFAHEQAYFNRMPDIDGLIRSHLHTLIAVFSSRDFGIITPCFQLPTEFSESNSLGYKPEIGGILLTLKPGKNPFTDVKITPILFELPKPKIIQIR